MHPHLWKAEIERQLRQIDTWFCQLWKLQPPQSGPAYGGCGPLVPVPPSIIGEWELAQANETIIATGTGLVTLYNGTLGAEMSTGQTVLAYSRFTTIQANSWIWVRANDNGFWEIMIPSGGGSSVVEGYLTTALAAPSSGSSPTTATMAVYTLPGWTTSRTITITNRDTSLALASGKYVQAVTINGENRIQWAAC